jgi:hypothetical protein
MQHRSRLQCSFDQDQGAADPENRVRSALQPDAPLADMLAAENSQ